MSTTTNYQFLSNNRAVIVQANRDHYMHQKRGRLASLGSDVHARRGNVDNGYADLSMARISQALSAKELHGLAAI